MESSGSPAPEQETGEKDASAHLQSALDELGSAAEKASGDVKSQIDSASEQIRAWSSSASSDLQGQLEVAGEKIKNASGDVVNELQKIVDRLQDELHKRREQLRGGGGDAGAAGDGDSGAT